jgi:hypothetical protein
MRVHERINLIFGTFMAVIYLGGGIFITQYANRLYDKPSLVILLGWVMIGYSLIRIARVYEAYKRWIRETKKRSIN